MNTARTETLRGIESQLTEWLATRITQRIVAESFCLTARPVSITVRYTRLKDKSRLTLAVVCVDTEHSRQGYATGVLAVLEALAADYGIDKVVVESIQNDAMRQCAIKAGYSRIADGFFFQRDDYVKHIQQPQQPAEPEHVQ